MGLTRKDFLELAFNLKDMFKELELLKIDTFNKDLIKNKILISITSFCRGQNENFDDYKFKSVVLD